MIDADRQGNASATLLRGQASPTLTNVLMKQSRLQEAIHQARERLYVVPSLILIMCLLITPVMEAGLLASDEMLIPCELESYAEGLFSMFAKLQDTLSDHALRNSGIIPYNVDLRYSMSRQYLKELRQEFNGLITAPIRTDATVPRAQSVQQTVFEYDPKSKVAEDFRTLAADLVEDGHEVKE